MGGRQRGVTTEIDLAGGSKPPQMKGLPPFFARLGPTYERGLGKVVLGRDRLHQAIRQLTFPEQNDGRRVPREPLGRKGVDLEHQET